MVLPASGLYLGFFDNAAGASGLTNGGMNTYVQLQSLEAQVGRHFAIDLHYSTWTADLASQSVIADLGVGRIPLISWQCGDTDTAVASGADDSLLVEQAKNIAALAKPVMIRWFWEMEFTGSNGGTQGARAARCLGSGGPAGYAAAWRHIVDVFRSNGATNVSWVFCPGQEAFNPQAEQTGKAAALYYPGDSYVDWIGEDAYSRATFVPITTLVAGMYEQYGNSGKPLVVCETGAEPADQATFLAGWQGLPAEYPNLRAVVYFDSHGPLGSYVLTGQALTAFTSLAHSAAFSAQPPVG